MKITKTQVAKYLSLRSEMKEMEEAMQGLKGQFMEALKERNLEPIETPAGRVVYVERMMPRLDEAKLMKKLGVDSLDAYKTKFPVESVLVTAK